MLVNEPNNVAIQLATIAMCLVVILSFPLFTWPIRFSLDRLLFPMWVSFYDSSPEAKSWKSQVRYYALTIFIVSFSLLIATVVGSLEVVFGLTGATGGALIKFIFPAACYWKLGPIYRRKFTDSSPVLPIWQKICVVVIVVVS